MDVKKTNLSRILLAVNFNHPFYQNIPMIKKYYSTAFPKIVYCGPEKSDTYKDIMIIASREHERGFFGYMCIAMAIRRFPAFHGYMYVNDDMIVNWWTMFRFPQNRIWSSKKINTDLGADMDKKAPCCWHWWTDAEALQRCKLSFDNLQKSVSKWNGEDYLKIYYENTAGKRLCLYGWSDFMYIPGRLSQTFATLAEEFYKNSVFLEVATFTIMTMLDGKENVVNVDGVYLPDVFGELDFSDGTMLAKVYSSSKSLYHPVKLSAGGIGVNLFRVAMDYGKLFLKNSKHDKR